MIWINNALGGRHWHGHLHRTVVGGVCCCADCIVERSSGLLAVGPIQAEGREMLRRLEHEGYVGLYRCVRKPWKERG